MRELKFRAFDKITETCFDFDFADVQDGRVEITDDLIVMQYINAKICQDDVIKTKYEDLLSIEREIVGVVEIGEFEVMLDFPNDGIAIPMRCLFTDELEDYEILGNIHENPNLLESPK